MKTRIQLLVLLITFSILIISCEDTIIEKRSYMANVPIYMPFEEFRASVKFQQPVAFQVPGKIYIKNQYLYVNESGKGIHIFDNSDPSKPINIGFINIVFNTDISIKENVLYANSYSDLVSLDITNPKAPVVLDRYNNAFPNVLLPLKDSKYPVAKLDQTKGIVVGWKIEKITEEIKKQRYPVDYYYAFDSQSLTNSEGSKFYFAGASSSTGLGGSMAQMIIKDNYLYAIHNNFRLKMFNISSKTKIVKGDSINLSRTVETIFLKDNYLFFGTTTGMLVYGLTDPAHPVKISEFNHITSCDPVVVQDNYAYVTLRTGNRCNGFVNRLDILDISNIKSPQLLKSYPMYNPFGLGIDNKTLFICDGSSGLKIYSTKDLYKITDNKLAEFKNIQTYDIIPYGGVAILIGSDGLFQYDYTDLQNIKLLSQIKITQ